MIPTLNIRPVTPLRVLPRQVFVIIVPAATPLLPRAAADRGVLAGALGGLGVVEHGPVRYTQCLQYALFCIFLHKQKSNKLQMKNIIKRGTDTLKLS